MPAVTIGDCDDLGMNCKTHFGLYPDLIDAMGKLLNFTWEDHFQVDNNWGLQPVSGPANRSGVWNGIFGSVINGNYMFNSGGWIWLRERYGLVDFVPSTKNSVLLALTPKPLKFDLKLFVRPFTSASWMGRIKHSTSTIQLLLNTD